MDGSRFCGIFQLNETVLPVTDSITGGLSGGSGRLTVKKLQLGTWDFTILIYDKKFHLT